MFRSYGPADGLVNSTVTHLLQDSQGLIWAGTDDGLFRYDGARFEAFGTQQGLVTAEIEALHQDRRGTLWVGTHAGVSRWNGLAFEPIPNLLGAQDHVRAIVDDDTGVWLATSKGLLVATTDHEFRPAAGWPGGEATALAVGRGHGKLWAARWDGKPQVLQLSQGVWSEFAFSGAGEKEHIDALAEDGDGRLWARSSVGLWQLDPERRMFDPVSAPNSLLSEPGYLSLGRHGDLWVSSSDRLMHREKGQWTETLGGLALGTRPVLEDREGSLWFGARGLQRMAGRGAFHVYDAAEGLPGNVAWSIARGLDRTLWIGTEYGLARAVGERFETIAGTEKLLVRTIAVAPDGKLYVAGIPGKDVLCVDPARHSVTRVELATDAPTRIYTLLLDAHGVLWATTDSRGLLRADTNATPPRFESEPLPNSEATPELLRGIDAGADQRLWVAGHAGLLLRENGHWRRFRQADGLRDDRLEYVRVMRNGDLVVAYGGTDGFDRLRYESGSLRTVSQTKFGTTRYVDSIFIVGEDVQSNVWIGTGRGIDRYTPDGMEHFGAQQGLAGEDTASMAFLADPNGDVWFGVVGGLVRFDAAKYRTLPARVPAPAELLDVRLGDARFAPDTPDLHVPYTANALNVRFASPSFVGDGNIQYRTLLHGLETQPNVTETREAHYAALSPGEYRFEVAARAGSTGAWGEPAVFDFYVVPAWWQSWWMRTLFGLCLLALVGLAVRWRLLSLQRRNQQLEESIAARTVELSETNRQLLLEIAERQRVEDRVQQRNVELEQLNQQLAETQSQLLQSEKMASVGQLAAGVAHEINNPIGFVHSNLGSLSRYVSSIFELLNGYEKLEGALPDDHPQRRAMNRLKSHVELEFLRSDIGELLDETLDGVTRVSKIVKDLKDFSHVDEAEWQRIDLHKSLDSTLNVVAHELKYKADLVKQYGTLPMIECLPFQINQVFLNLFVNAVQAIEDRGTITIRTGADGAEVWASITDTGKGIQPAVLHRIFEPFFTTKPVGVGTGLGLSVSYSIVRKHGGHITVQSTPGHGTTFTVHLPIEPRHVPAADAPEADLHRKQANR